MQLARRAVLTSSALAVVLFSLAMRIYPGGTSWDRGARGHDFWLNYLCDLARPTALDGTPNPVGSAIGQAGMLSLSVGLLAAFWLVARLAPSHPRTGVGVRALGTLAVAGVFAVVALPGDRFGALHGIACVAAGIPGLLAALLAVAALLRDGEAPRTVAWAGLLTLLAASADFAFYLPDVLHLTPSMPIVAVLERVSLVLLVGWMLLVAHASRAEPA